MLEMDDDSQRSKRLCTRTSQWDDDFFLLSFRTVSKPLNKYETD